MLNQTEIIEYLNGHRKDVRYEEARKMYHAIKVHANGEYPALLIDERRPHESDYIHIYRKKIYEAITKETVGPVITTLGKIRRSSDWMIRYDKPAPKNVREGETLKDYCEFNYPFGGSVTNWVFTELLKTYLLDANGLVITMPLPKLTADDTEFLRPVARIFTSDEIVTYVPGQCVIYRSKEIIDVIADTPRYFYALDTMLLTTYQQTDKGPIVVGEPYAHNLGYLPVEEMRGLFLKELNGNLLCESRINIMLPRLNEAVREYSDQQANVVNHLFPERWEYSTQQCDGCSNGTISTGLVTTGKGNNKVTVQCKKCNGTGNLTTTGPYSKLVVRQADTLNRELPAPIPPAGYITKSTDIFKAIDERIAYHQNRALSAINMQFLDKTPLAESGIAKDVDKDELNNFVYGIAEDLVRIMDKVYKIICDMRYSIVVPDAKARKEMLPFINVPEKYDLLSSTYLVEEITQARNAKVNPTVIAAMELDFVNKKFYTQPELKVKLESAFTLDPMPGATDDEKMTRLSNNGCTQEDYIVSVKLATFIEQAIEEKPDFLKMKRKEQLTILYKYAADQLAASRDEMIEVEPTPPVNANPTGTDSPTA